MRILAVLPALMCTVALVLSFLCLFAGSKRNFMEDYAIVTVGRLSGTRRAEAHLWPFLHSLEA